MLNGLKSISRGTGRREQHVFNVPGFICLLASPLGHGDVVEGELQVKNVLLNGNKHTFM